MSDYLGNLAAKSLAPEQAAIVQPRLASRFEPVAPEAPVLVEETVERIAAPSPTPAPVKPDSFSPSPPERGGRGVRPRRAERSDVQEALETPEPSGRIARMSGVPFEASPPDPLSRGERGNKTVEMEVVRRVAAERSEVPSESSPPVPLSRGERGNVEPAVVVEPKPFHHPLMIPPPIRQDAPATSPLSPRERGTGGEASRASRPEPHKPPEQKATLPPLQPRIILPERLPLAPRPEPAAPQPVINVTIGRIEVRATPAPKAPARERQAARPAVDLEEYLRQRSRGEGR